VDLHFTCEMGNEAADSSQSEMLSYLLTEKWVDPSSLWSHIKYTKAFENEEIVKLVAKSVIDGAMNGKYNANQISDLIENIVSRGWVDMAQQLGRMKLVDPNNLFFTAVNGQHEQMVKYLICQPAFNVLKIKDYFSYRKMGAVDYNKVPPESPVLELLRLRIADTDGRLCKQWLSSLGMPD
jgi:hypothetical protein